MLLYNDFERQKSIAYFLKSTNHHEFSSGSLKHQKTNSSLMGERFNLTQNNAVHTYNFESVNFGTKLAEFTQPVHNSEFLNRKFDMQNVSA